MPRELTQNRIQKIWVPTKDDKPAPRRVPRNLCVMQLKAHRFLIGQPAAPVHGATLLLLLLRPRFWLYTK
eukprot:superscaffoldBa00000571_g5716